MRTRGHTKQASRKHTRAGGTVTRRTKLSLVHPRANGEVLGLFLKNMPGAVAMLDREMRYMVASSEWLNIYGMDGRDIVGRSHYEIFPELPARTKEIHGRCLMGAVERCDEERLLRADGMEEWVRWEIRPWRDAGGDVGGLLMYTEVITPQVLARRAMEQREERYRSLFEHSTDLITIVDEQWRICFGSPSVGRALGYAAEEYTGRPASDFVHPDDLEGAKIAFHSAFSAPEKSVVFQLRVRARNGTWRVVESVGSSIVDESGGKALVINSRDITERTILEHELHESEERLRVLINSMPDVVCFKDGKGRWLVANDAMVQLFRLEGREYREKCAAELAAWVPELRSAFEASERSDEEAWQSGTLLRSDELVPAPDGVTRVYDVIKVPLFQRDGSRKGLVVVGRDITEKEYAQRELRLLAQTVASARDCVSICRLDSTILFVNDAFLKTYGYEEDELIGQDISVIHAKGNAGRIPDSAPFEGWYGEVLDVRKDGTLFPVELWISVVRNDEGEPVASVGVARDITERRKSEEQIKTSLREKEVLLKEIHHRVKNNLQIISSLLNLQSEYITDPEMLKIFKESQNRVKSMALIHEKLYQSSNLAAIDFGGYVRGLTTHLVRSYGGGVRGISVQVDAEELSLGLDRAVPCGIILNELLSNSLKHAFPDGSAGSIRVELRLLDGRDIVLTVLDDGVGLPADFDLLTSESLGLKLVRMLADQLQGKMSVESHSRAEGENHGTIFRIQFER